MAGALSFIAREDTLLGACFALGEDFGFNPVYLRLAFAVGLFFSPAGAIAAYAGCFVVVALSRLAAPDPRPAEAEAAEGPANANEQAPGEFPLAA
jgi:phage shock protein PspC (stress-responsive transcriptional regulator)